MICFLLFCVLLVVILAWDNRHHDHLWRNGGDHD
jgi:hypothetical protein